jgi:hypothetical protein
MRRNVEKHGETQKARRNTENAEKHREARKTQRNMEKHGKRGKQIYRNVGSMRLCGGTYNGVWTGRMELESGVGDRIGCPLTLCLVTTQSYSGF